MKAHTDNRRVRYTKMFLRESLLELLREKPIKNITVTELCAAADINRGTFYNYYDDVFDLFEQIEKEFLAEVENSVSGSELAQKFAGEESANIDKEIFFEYISNILTVIVKNRDLCSILFGPNGDKEFLRNTIYIAHDFYVEKWLRITNDKKITRRDLDYVYTYLANGSVGIIQDWIYNGMRLPIKDIAEIISFLTMHGISAYITK